MPTTITTINASDALEPTSRNVINNNFSSLNTNKLEVSNNLSDVTSKPTAINNILPSQTGNNGKFLTTNGSVASWGNAAGVPDASTTVKGIMEISATPVDPVIPIALGVNDVKAPQVDVSTITADIVGAMAGSGIPSASNKYLTTDTFTTEQALTEKVANKDTTTTLGTSDTKYPSQKAVKTYVDTATAIVAGTVLIQSADTERTNNYTSPTLVKEIYIGKAGTYTVKFDMKNDVGTAHLSYGRIYKNSSAFGTLQSTNSLTYVTETENLAFSAGDLIQVYAYSSSGSDYYIKNFRLYTAFFDVARVNTD